MLTEAERAALLDSLARLAELAGRALEGGWRVKPGSPQTVITGDIEPFTVANCRSGPFAPDWTTARANATFIAEARQAVPELVAACRRLLLELDAVLSDRDFLKNLVHDAHCDAAAFEAGRREGFEAGVKAGFEKGDAAGYDRGYDDANYALEDDDRDREDEDDGTGDILEYGEDVP